MQNREGKLLVFEGPDGTGKSKISDEVTKWLGENNVRCTKLAFPGNQVGTLGKLVYDLHHRAQDFGIHDIQAVSLQTLHIAAHMDAITTIIRPKLQEGTWVVLDRYWWSTWVYGRAADVPEYPLDRLIEAEKYYWGTIRPASAFLISRATQLREENTEEVFSKLSALYDEISKRESAEHPVRRIVNETLDASLEQVFAQIELE